MAQIRMDHVAVVLRLERGAYNNSVHTVEALVSCGASLQGTNASIAAAVSRNENPEQIKIMEYLLENNVNIDHV